MERGVLPLLMKHSRAKITLVLSQCKLYPSLSSNKEIEQIDMQEHLSLWLAYVENMEESDKFQF